MNKKVDQYIETFPKDIQEKLRKMRKIIRETVPEAEEVISYQMPAYKLGKILTAFEKELAEYKHAKGSIQFPIDKPLPTDLIRKIVEFRIKEF